MKKFWKWTMRVMVCRRKGHAPGLMMPFFEPWYGGMCKGTLHCARCGSFMQEVNYVKGVKG